MKKYILLVVVVFIGCNSPYQNKKQQFDYFHNKFDESEMGWIRNYNNLDSMYFYSGKMHAYKEILSYIIDK